MSVSYSALSLHALPVPLYLAAILLTYISTDIPNTTSQVSKYEIRQVSRLDNKETLHNLQTKNN